MSGTESWIDRAACSELVTKEGNYDTFFPRDNYERPNVARAKKICRGCSVQLECLFYATSNDIDVGVWGGADPAERKRIKRMVPFLGRKNATLHDACVETLNQDAER